MKILILTPLFPPHNSSSARYVKELTRQLECLDNTQVSVLLYGKIPEEVAGVQIERVSKFIPVPLSIGIYWFKLLKMTFKSDLIIINNGPGVELPTLLTFPFLAKKAMFVISDEGAQQKLRGLTKRIHTLLENKLPTIHPPVSTLVVPEKHPFKEVASFALYEQNWEIHKKELIAYAG